MGSTLEELQLAARNHGMPLEALRWAVTPVGLHYLLIHFDIAVVDEGAWQLHVQDRNLSLDELKSRPYVRTAVTMECAGNGRARLEPHVASQPWLQEAVGTAEWGGTPLRPLLEEASHDAVEVLFTGLDRGVDGGVPQVYERSLPLAEAMRDEVLLAWEMNGEPLPAQHGFPLRLVVPGWYGMASVKWLERITLLDQPFDGYQQTHSYRFREHEGDDGEPIDRMLPRALMVPPGVPEFFSRQRLLEPGLCRLEGRAWSGLAPIEAVAVSTDGGATWASANLEPSASPWAWSHWSLEWHAEPGEHVLTCRARDEAGNEQPLEARWNVGGYANNAVQRVPVTVQP